MQNFEDLTEEEKRRVVGQCSYLLITLYSTVAIFCGLSSTAWCDFVARDIQIAPPYNLTTGCQELGLQQVTCDAFMTDHSVGLYAFQVTIPVNHRVCTSYVQEISGVGWVEPDFDSKFRAVQVFALIANFFGLFAWFTLALSSCCPLRQDRIKGLSVYFFFATFFQGMTLLILKSDVCKAGFFRDYLLGSDQAMENLDKVIGDVSCSLDRGSKLAISATVFYFLAMGQTPTAVAPMPIGYTSAAAAMDNMPAPDQNDAGQDDNQPGQA